MRYRRSFMKKQIVTLLLAGCLAVGCFAGCKDSEKESTPTNKPTSKPTASATATVKPTEAATATPAPTATPGADATNAPVVNPDDAVIFRFDSDGDFEYTFENPKMLGPVDASEETGLILTFLGHDPYTHFTGFDPFDLQEYPFMKVCIMNPTPETTFELFLIPTEQNRAAVAEDCFTGEPISAEDTEFKSYVFDIAKSCGADYLNRTIEAIRLDCIQMDESDVTDYEFYLKYVAFFKTEAEANAYQ